MADPVLATVEQLEVRLGHTVDADRATALLEDASAIVRGYTRQYFTRVIDDVATLPVNRGKVILPQQPAEKPTLIARVDGTGVYPAASWWWGGVGIVEFGSPGWLANGPSYGRSPRSVIVTYTHGYEDIPGDVVAIVCQMVARVIEGTDTHGLRSESIDDYQYQLGGGIVSGAVALVPAEMHTLDRYRRRVGSVVLR
ncbi:head-tail adaptor [Arthrobacter phage Constance]|uniref:Head-to-tail adaptor n=1 Tax=Arthrobacter phage Constance TaxID=2419950 RepID=A0A3G2KEQ9_9CAUD|nr:head-tail adaptor [Arthrobacter phage Constance]AYN57415.1 head-to-tail adaptor [Arthrobacter phage Constance]WMI32950.1 head-to-tail adaptor [Arthrobacter phage PeggyLeg03]